MPATTLPTSGLVLGALVDDLGLHLKPTEVARSARGYFAGQRDVKDSTREAITAAIASALVNQKYVPAIQPLPPPFESKNLVDLVATVIDGWGYQWDAVVAGIESEAMGPVSSEFVALACLRLVVVELAIRVAGFVRLSRGRPMICRCGYCTGAGVASPHWVEMNGRRELLADLKNQLGATSLEDFAESLGFSPSAVDEWMREESPSRPSEEALDTIATALVRESRGGDIDRSELIVWLRWQFALSATADRLATVLGRERVKNLGWAFERLLASAQEFLRHSHMKEPEFRERMLLVLVSGSRAPQASFLMNTLATNEHEPAWADTVRATANGWGAAIATAVKVEQSKLRVADVLVREDGHAPAEAKMLAEIVTRDLPYAATRPHAPATSKADALIRLSVEAQRRGDLASSAVYLRGAVDLDPDRPELHQDLGGTLGKIGRFDEGLAECRRALELRPGWASPMVHIGIILLDAGRNEEALSHLKDVAQMIEWSVLLGHTLGIAQMRAQRFPEAIVSFERVLIEVPKHSSALDLAAHCYLMLWPPDWARGRALAKQAHAVGAHETWQALQAGHYHRLANERKKIKTTDKE